MTNKNSMRMLVNRTNSNDKDFSALIELLDAELYERYGNKQDDYNEYNTLEEIKHVVILYYDDDPVGCGSFKEYDKSTVEIKRMFLKRNARGSGGASSILNELEQWAAELGYSACILETGKGQPDAIKFYTKCGYTFIENFGQYKGMPLSVCMNKKIT